MIDNPSFNALRSFEVAARHLSFSRAAEELQVTPGAISQQISQLEAWSGTLLFRRNGRRVMLTEAGQMALPLLSHAFRAMAEAGHIMRSPSRRGRLMVSAAPSFAAKWLAPRLDAFQNRCSGIEIWISAETGLVDFSDPEIDLAIRYGSGEYEHLHAEKLLSESVLPVCAPGLLESDPGLHSPADLHHFTLLHDRNSDNDPSCPGWSDWLKARGVANIDAERGPRFNQDAMVVEAAMSGRGVALAKRAIAASDLATGRLVAPFADGGASVDFAYWTVWPRWRTLSAAARDFLGWLRTEARAEEFGGV